MSAAIEDRLKKSYRPSFDDDAWVNVLFADQLKVAEEENDWYNAVCQRCPYFIDGANTQNYVKKLVECHADDPDVVESSEAIKIVDSTEIRDVLEPKPMKWAEIPLIQCMRSEATECLADSFIVSALVFSQLAQEKQVLELMRARMLKWQQDYKQTQSNNKRNSKIVKSRRQ